MKLVKDKPKSKESAPYAEEDVLPTIHEVAKEFLAAEPREEIEEIEAAMHKSVANLEESMSEDSQDQEEVGTGIPISAFGYIEGAIKGIIDRLKVSIEDVAFIVHFEAPVDSPGLADAEDVDCSLRFHLDELDVEGITSRIPGEHRHGKRRVLFRGIQSNLTSSGAFFESLQRVASMHSRAVTHSSPALSRGIRSPSPASGTSPIMSHSITQSTDAASSTHSSNHPLAQSRTSTIDDRLYPAHNMEASLQSHRSRRSHRTVDDRFADASDEEDDEAEDEGEDIDDEGNNFLASSNIWSARHADVVEDEQGEMFPLEMDVSALRRSRISSSHSSTHSTPPQDQIRGAPVIPEHILRQKPAFLEGLQLHTSTGDPRVIQQSNSSSSSSSAGEDLTESRFFTHEEAQSMYQSAMSEMPQSASEHHQQQTVPSPFVSNIVGQETLDSPTLDNHDTETPTPQSPIALATQGSGGLSRYDLQQADPVTKELVSVDEISIYVPWAGDVTDLDTDEDSQSTDGSVDQSTAFDMPGAFSHSPKSTHHHQPRPSAIPSKAKSTTAAQQRATDASSESDQQWLLQVIIGSLHGKIDISTGTILFALIEQIMDSLQHKEHVPSPIDKKSSQESQDKSISLHINHLHLSLWEHVAKILKVESAMQSVPQSQTEPEDSLLVLDAKHTDITLELQDALTRVKLVNRKFTLGFHDYDIISFDTPNLEKSVSASRFEGMDDNDFTIKYESSESRGPELHVNTQKLAIDIDLPKIDEKLTCYGGLSGILDLSASIASNSGVLRSPARKGLVETSSKDTIQPTAAPSSANIPVKANIRLEGIKFTVQGKRSGIWLQSSSVKAILRNDNVTLRTSHIQAVGPFESSKPLTIDLMDPELSFFFAPRESDLTGLLSLITPSRDPYEDDDDILLDTLLRQRKKGSLLRVNVGDVYIKVPDIGQIEGLESLGDELAKFGNVAKYLPEDDRPGILTLVEVKTIETIVNLREPVGNVTLQLSGMRLAHVGLPALLAMEIGKVDAWIEDDEIVHPLLKMHQEDELPMIMGKIIGDEMEPTIKVKVFNLAAEYRVSTLMRFLGLSQQATTEDLAASMAQSVGTIRAGIPGTVIRQTSGFSDSSSDSRSKPFQLSILLRDCAIGLNPTDAPAKGVFLLQDAHITFRISVTAPIKGNIELRKAAVFAIDDIEQLSDDIIATSRASSRGSVTTAHLDLPRVGYQSLITIQSAMVSITAVDKGKGKSTLNVDATNEVIVFETCADSTQTLIQIIDGLKPPSMPENTPQYRTDAMLPQDLMDEFQGEEFYPEEPEFNEEGASSFGAEEEELRDAMSDDSYDMVGSFYSTAESEEEFPRSKASAKVAKRKQSIVSNDALFNGQAVSFSTGHSSSVRSTIDDDNVLDESLKAAKVKSWNSASKRHNVSANVPVKNCPVYVTAKVTTFIWNMFDGYDWLKTRETISQAVEAVQNKAAQRRANKRRSIPEIDDEESEIGDTLFQSIWISVPADRDENDLTRRINRNLQRDFDTTSESGTATTAITQTSERPALRRRKSRTLRLERSRRRKVSIEIRNLMLDLRIFPPNVVETQSIINVRVHEFEIYDHMPSSTWRKFLTAMHDGFVRPTEYPMAHLRLLNVKPQLDLAATELVIKVRVTPLRLHVDQDTLDFITRFFEFKDDTKPISEKPADPPFIQRCEVSEVALRLDYKPKKVDYAGLRSGRTKELANFVTLDEANIKLRRLILFGITGFDNLHKSLNDIWVADVTKTQLVTVLQGLAPVRPLVNVGVGVRQLIVVPLAEYQKDGRIIRSVRKGAFAFAKTTTSELARLGGKIALGTGNILAGAEALLSPLTAPDSDSFSLPASRDPSPARAISYYANQPLTVTAGLRSAVRHLERDLASARDAIIAVGTDVGASESAGDVARAVARAAPIVILKPAIGATKAIGSALLGAGNALDPTSRRKLEDVSFHVVCMLELSTDDSRNISELCMFGLDGRRR